jgi:hypothetical protein
MDAERDLTANGREYTRIRAGQSETMQTNKLSKTAIFLRPFGFASRVILFPFAFIRVHSRLKEFCLLWLRGSLLLG